MIPGIGSVGGAELLIPLILILLLFGPKRLPELGRSFGIGLKELRREAGGSGDERDAEQRQRYEDEKDVGSGTGSSVRGEGNV